MGGDANHMAKIQRIGRYLEVLADLGKVPWLFRNVVALSAEEFDAVFVDAPRGAPIARVGVRLS